MPESTVEAVITMVALVGSGLLLVNDAAGVIALIGLIAASMVFIFQSIRVGMKILSTAKA